MNPEVRARVIIEGDATALQKAIEKTDQQAKALNKTVKEFNLGEATDRAAQAIHERQAVEQELIRRRVIDDPNVIARRKRIDAEGIQRRQAMQTMAMQGLSLSGMGGVAGGYGQGLAIGSAMEGAGMAGLARLAGPVGAGIGASAMLASTLKRAERYNPWAINADPHFDPQARARGFLGALPGGETALGYYDTFSGRTAGMQRNTEEQERLKTRLGYETRAADVLSDVGRRQTAGSAERIAASQYQLPMPQIFDRSTGTGQRMAREAAALEEPRKRAVLAERELSKATSDRMFLERQSLELNEDRRLISIDIKSQEKLTKETLEASNLQAMKAINSQGAMRGALGGINPLLGVMYTASQVAFGGSDVAVDAARRREMEFRKREGDISSKQQIQNQNELQAARTREAMAQRAKAGADIDIMRANLQNLQAREEFASAGAQRIGGMGPGGRATGIAALSALQGIGIENATPELIAQAEAVAPATVANWREAASRKLFAGDFGNQLRGLGVDEEDLQPGRLDKLRDDVDKKRLSIPPKEQAADEALGRNMEAATQSLSNIIKRLAEELPRLEQELDLKLRLMRNGPNT